MRRLLLALALLLTAAPAWADSGMMLGGVSNRRMPFDPPLTTSTAAYSTRRLTTAYTANKAINVVRASDSAVSDIGFRADGSPDTATLTTFCNATTCKLVTIYDQIGSRNLTQATDANRPPIVVSCLNSRACFQITSATVSVASAANFTPAAALASISGVAMYAIGGASTCSVLRENGANNRVIGGSAQYQLVGGTSGVVATNIAAGSWAAGQGVINGASSVFGINGTETTGTATGNTTAGLIQMIGNASTTCNQVEAAFWDNYGLTAAERAYLNGNQRPFWGF